MMAVAIATATAEALVARAAESGCLFSYTAIMEWQTSEDGASECGRADGHSGKSSIFFTATGNDTSDRVEAVHRGRKTRIIFSYFQVFD